MGTDDVRHKRNKEILRRLNEETWAEGKLGLVDELVADDYIEHNTASPEPIRGPDGYKENVEMVRAAFPDMDVALEHVIGEHDTVAYYYTITGTHQGPLMGIEPTGVEVAFSGMGIARVEDGELVESWSNVDLAGLMDQLGATPG